MSAPNLERESRIFNSDLDSLSIHPLQRKVLLEIVNIVVIPSFFELSTGMLNDRVPHIEGFQPGPVRYTRGGRLLHRHLHV